MSTPRELLAKRDELAQRVAERELARADAIASLRAEAAKHPELLDQLATDWAGVQIDRGVKKYVIRRNKADSAQIARDLARVGLEQPGLDGTVDHDWFTAAGRAESTTLRTDGEYVSGNLASAWRLVRSFEMRQEEHELLLAAVGDNADATRERAIEALNQMPEARQRVLRARIRARLHADRLTFVERRYSFGEAAEG